MAKSDKANEKTNVMRLLDQAGIAYTPRYYDASLASGTEVAAALGQSAEGVFKTLVAEANTGEHFVFVIPAPETLSLKKAAKAAGVNKHISYHTSRHTFATMMLTLGVDIYTTSKLLGHSNVATTQIYSKIVDEKKVEAVNKVDNLFD